MSVRGNCDWNNEFQEKIIIPTPLGNLIMKHRPYLGQDDVNEFKPAFFVHGHTHRPLHIANHEYITICPGSTSFPRGGSKPQYIILEVNEKNYSIKTIGV